MEEMWRYVLCVISEASLVDVELEMVCTRYVILGQDLEG